MTPTDVPSPGGWLRLLNTSIARKVYIGSATAAVGVLSVFGLVNGAQAEHHCQVPLTTNDPGELAFSCENPFSGTGLLVLTDDQGIYQDEPMASKGSLDVGISATQSGSGQDILNNVTLNTSATDKFIAVSATGSTAFKANGVIKVPEGSFITGTWSTGSGETTSGNDVGYVNFTWINCSDVAATVDC